MATSNDDSFNDEFDPNAPFGKAFNRKGNGPSRCTGEVKFVQTVRGVAPICSQWLRGLGPAWKATHAQGTMFVANDHAFAIGEFLDRKMHLEVPEVFYYDENKLGL
jgi:hypothetical protein